MKTNETIISEESFVKENNMDLLAQICTLSKERELFPRGLDPRRPVGIFCSLHQLVRAWRHVKAGWSGPISSFLLPDTDWSQRYRLKLVSSRILRMAGGPYVFMLDECVGSAKFHETQWCLFGAPSILQWMAFRLARLGMRRVWFVQDPEYGKCWRLDQDEFRANKAELVALVESMQDADSRRTVLSILRQRLTGDTDYVYLPSYRQYEHPNVCAIEGDIVVEAGAEKGEHARIFSQAVGPSGHVYAFEPAPHVLSECQQAIDSCRNVSILPVALGQERGSQSFILDNCGQSHVDMSRSDKTNALGRIEVVVRTLDDFVCEQGLARVNFIKMDTEGYEMPILRGALQSLRRYRPKLQISIYHKPKDLWEIPAWIRQQVPGYRFYIGHHSWQWETVLYAVHDSV